MEVTASTFPRHLLRLLDDISRAEFVALDLELTGIPSRLPKKGPVNTGCGKKTLQDRYAETKEAADRYQILQVGLTCGTFDVLIGKYVLRPYNITLSPLLEERLDIEREICIQSGAATFLLNNGFDMGAPFANGVQYLSREEASRAKQLAFDRIDKKNVIEDVQLKVEDIESIAFVKRVRDAITRWMKSPYSDYILEISSHTGLPSAPKIQTISRFEKRLVHQLVRADFPTLVTVGFKDECIKIMRFNAAREEENTKRMKKRTRDAIARQTGFRWVFEALANGDISETNPFHSRIIVDSRVDVKGRWDAANDRLQHNQPVIVGHNMFTDLVYFYRSFVGELPESLDDFCAALHGVFPRIIDTKWLATYAEGDLNASPSLQDIAESLQDQALPTIATHHEHSQYHDKKAYHEAGFDSLLTATIMLQISARLHHERELKAPTDGGSEDSFRSAVETQDPFLLDGQEKVMEPVALPPLFDPQENAFTTKTKKKNKRNKKKVADKPRPKSTRFQSKNPFDNLGQFDLESDSTLEPNPGATLAEESVRNSFVPIEKMERKPMELIPDFDSPFWTEFGNKLRIFGTKEAVLHIAEWKKPVL